MLGKRVREHVVRLDQGRLDLPSFDRFSKVMDLHVDVSHLSSHWIVRSFDCALTVAEHVGREPLLAGDLLENVPERNHIDLSLRHRRIVHRCSHGSRRRESNRFCVFAPHSIGLSARK